MEEEFKLATIDFKNRFYLFFLLMPIPFILFITTFLIYFLIRKTENEFFFILTFIVFLIELQLFTHIASKLRYIPTGQAKINQERLKIDNVNYKWENIKRLNFFYRGDKFWKSNIPIMNCLKPYYRYHNLFWHARVNNEKFMDKIEIDGLPVYFKIRNEQEREKFFKIKELASSKGIYVNEEQTDFSYKLFGKEMKI